MTSNARQSSWFVPNLHVFHAPALVVATGGLSIPKMGATAFGYDLARQLGLNIRKTRLALCPSYCRQEIEAVLRFGWSIGDERTSTPTNLWNAG